MLIGEGMEVRSTAGFVEASGANDDELLALAQALGVDGRRSADHANGGELGDGVGDGHEVGDGAEGLGGKGSVQPGHDDAFAQRDELDGERNDGGVEELDLVDANDFYVGELGVEGGAEIFDGGDSGGFMGLRAVRGDGRAMVAEVDVGLEAGDALAGNTCTLEAADKFFGLAREHGAGDDFEDAGDGSGLLHVW